MPAVPGKARGEGRKGRPEAVDAYRHARGAATETQGQELPAGAVWGSFWVQNRGKGGLFVNPLCQSGPSGSVTRCSDPPTDSRSIMGSLLAMQILRPSPDPLNQRLAEWGLRPEFRQLSWEAAAEKLCSRDLIPARLGGGWSLACAGVTGTRRGFRFRVSLQRV